MLSFKSLKMFSLALILLLMCNTSYAKTVNIKSTHAYTEDEIYFLDTEFDFKLTEEANEALLHGIPLEIHIHFQLRLKRKWLWDRTVSEKIIIFKLEHMPLTNKFLTIDINTGLRNSYINLDSALSHINTISKMKLFDHNLLDKEKNYIARIKTFLDIGSLPTPLRPQAYFSPDWDIASEWFEWEVLQ
jgi:hypothetical protein